MRCLSGKEILTYFKWEKAYLSQEKAFFGWKKCYVHCNTRFVTLYRSQTSPNAFVKFDIGQLWMSR
jgi:hypothetical protein